MGLSLRVLLSTVGDCTSGGAFLALGKIVSVTVRRSNDRGVGVGLSSGQIFSAYGKKLQIGPGFGNFLLIRCRVTAGGALTLSGFERHVSVTVGEVGDLGSLSCSSVSCTKCLVGRLGSDGRSLPGLLLFLGSGCPTGS